MYSWKGDADSARHGGPMTRLINLYALDYWYESDAEDPEGAYTLIGDEKAETHNEQVKAELQNG